MANRTSGTYQATLIAAGVTAQSAQSVQTNSNSAFSGQTMTIGSGTVTSALDPANPVAKNVTANQTFYVAKFNFTAVNDTFTISEIQLKTLASKSEAGIQNVILKKADGTVVGSLPLAKSASSQFVTLGSLAGLSVPANDPNGLTLTAAVQTGGVGINLATSGLNVGISLNYYKNAPISTGTIATDSNVRAGNNQYLYASLPVITPVALPTTTLSNGTQSISKFTIGATGGTVGWQEIL